MDKHTALSDALTALALKIEGHAQFSRAWERDARALGSEVGVAMAETQGHTYQAVLQDLHEILRQHG